MNAFYGSISNLEAIAPLNLMGGGGEDTAPSTSYSSSSAPGGYISRVGTRSRAGEGERGGEGCVHIVVVLLEFSSLFSLRSDKPAIIVLFFLLLI